VRHRNSSGTLFHFLGVLHFRAMFAFIAYYCQACFLALRTCYFILCWPVEDIILLRETEACV
jgi:hypothetical protein